MNCQNIDEKNLCTLLPKAILLVIFTSAGFCNEDKMEISVNVTPKNLSLYLEDGRCWLSFFDRVDGEINKIVYSSEPSISDEKSRCEIHINKLEFKSHFDFCALTGISNIPKEGERSTVDFLGPTFRHDRGFFFEWNNADSSYPSYTCYKFKGAER